MRKGKQGFFCHDCDAVQPTPYSNGVRAERFAALKGWKIVPDGDIVCPGCAVGLRDAVPLCLDTAAENARRARWHRREVTKLLRARNAGRRKPLPVRGPGKRERARKRAQAYARPRQAA